MGILGQQGVTLSTRCRAWGLDHTQERRPSIPRLCVLKEATPTCEGAEQTCPQEEPKETRGLSVSKSSLVLAPPVPWEILCSEPSSAPAVGTLLALETRTALLYPGAHRRYALHRGPPSSPARLIGGSSTRAGPGGAGAQRLTNLTPLPCWAVGRLPPSLKAPTCLLFLSCSY